MQSYWYIYYRIDRARKIDARARVAKMFREIEQRTGIVGQLLQKMEEPLTWMETYAEPSSARVDGTLAGLLASLPEKYGLIDCLVAGSTRSQERFVAVEDA